MSKQQTMEKIKKIVDRYKKLSDIDKKKYNEQQTKDHFIRPLFEALGWDFENDVWAETDVSGKRVDYALKINNVTKFFIEAKPMSVNLDEERWAEQAINYSWHKSVPWVVLTDFEAIKVYNTEWDEPNIQSCQFIEIPYTEYLTSEKLWWLSKEAFIEAVLDKQADQVGRRPKTIIDKQLANDLIRWRDLLYKNLCSYNPRINKGKIVEYVQRILDRLIFIRTLEDRKIEDVTLQPLAREWKEKKGIKANELLFALNKVFRKIDSGYDSGLFEKGSCDQLGEKIDADDNDFVEIIEDLYKTRKGVRYNFADIPADIFGSIYEQYLGHIQQEDEQESKKSKRKSQGIYYTPRWVVDYIIKNTLGEVLKNKTEEEVKNIKILDPACGSGSFLITAYQTLIDYWQNHQKNIFAGRGDKLEQLERAFKKRNGILISPEQKQRILLNNIYGVDLDDEAIELARLNLLLKMVGRRIKLPSLSHNIKIGNSLIDDEKIPDKAFNWQKNFSEVFRQDGFDVIVGNPPYIKEYVDKSVFDSLHNSPYYQGKMDIWTMFACKAIDILKDGGYFSFIAPNNWLTNTGASIFRDKILQAGEIVSFVDFGDYKVFQDAGIQTMIFIFRKCEPKKNYKINYTRVLNKEVQEEKIIEFLNLKTLVRNSDVDSFVIPMEYEKNIGKNIFFVNSEKDKILNKILSKKNFELMEKEIGQGVVSPQEYVIESHINKLNNPSIKIRDGIFTLSSREKENLDLPRLELKLLKPFYTTKQINRYFCDRENDRWIIYTDSKFKDPKEIKPYPNIKKHLDKFQGVITSSNKPYGLHRAREERFFKGEKIIAVRKCVKPTFCYNDFDCYVSATFYVLKSDRVNLKYLVGLLNTKLMEFWLKYKGKMQGDNFQLDKEPLLEMPIFVSDEGKQKEIVKLVDKIIKLNQDLQKLDPDLDDKEYEQIKKEIEETEREIDKKIYELYGLTEEERKIIGGILNIL